MEVFEDSDGEIKRLEEEAAADPSAKIHLIRYLQARRGSKSVEKVFSYLFYRPIAPDLHYLTGALLRDQGRAPGDTEPPRDQAAPHGASEAELRL